MIQTSIIISNKLGLHARASAKFTKLAGGFPCEVFLTRNGRRVNAKSIMGVMMLAAGLGSEVQIETDGAREEEAMQALRALIEDKFGEGGLFAFAGHRQAQASALSSPRKWRRYLAGRSARRSINGRSAVLNSGSQAGGPNTLAPQRR